MSIEGQTAGEAAVITGARTGRSGSVLTAITRRSSSLRTLGGVALLNGWESAEQTHRAAPPREPYLSQTFA